MTNVAICGANGKMGKTIYSCIKDREDCRVVAGIDLYTEQYADFPIVDAPSKLPVKPDVIIDFSNPYHIAGQAVLVKKGSPVKSIRDLSGKTAIIIFGSTSEQSLRTAIPNLKVIGYKTYTEALNALKDGKGDAIVSDDTILLGMQLKDDSVTLLPKRYTKEPYAVAFRKGIESRDLIRAVNNVIDIETRNGQLKKIKLTFGIK